MLEIDRAFTDENVLTWLGMRLVTHRPGFARIELPVRREFIQTAGAVHGGIVATVADCSLACALLSELEPGLTCSTIDLNISYLARIREGTLRADSSTIRRGKRVGVSRTDLFRDDGEIVASAMGTFLIHPVCTE